MMKKEEIEDLADRTLNSLDGLQQAEANPYLFAKVKHRLIERRQQVAAVQLRVMVRLTALLLLFVAINVSSFYLMGKGQGDGTEAGTQQKAKGLDALRQEYFGSDNSYSY